MFSLIRVALVMVARHSCRKPNRDSCLLQSPVLNPWPPALCGTVLRMCKLYEVRPHWEKWVTGNVSLGLEDSILSQIYRFLLLPDPYEENMPFHRRLLVANMFSLQTQKHLGPKTMHWKLGKLDLKWFPPCSICYMGYSSAKKKEEKKKNPGTYYLTGSRNHCQPWDSFPPLLPPVQEGQQPNLSITKQQN